MANCPNLGLMQGTAGLLGQLAPADRPVLAVAIGVVAGYAALMLAMALGGFVLAKRTRGARALDLLGSAASGGQVARTRGESWLARCYAAALFVGLIGFYVAIPLVVAALLVFTGLALYLLFSLRRVPVKGIILILLVGLGGAWAVLKSLFSRTGSGAFGLPKTAAELPQVHRMLQEVAQKVETSPVDVVYLAPGSSIGVHQEGRGPFGLFGVKRRVLTLGLSTMQSLTVSEVQAILAHEYAHFSHRDTFYSRFIYQVSLSIGNALSGLAATGGVFNYINPCYWFLWLYHRAYSLLASGFSRSREFLADRMAARIYGADVFTSALTKVATEGQLFEMTIYDNINELLNSNQAFDNMYTAFRGFRDEQLDAEQRKQLYDSLCGERESLFASHPSFHDRLEAIAGCPAAAHRDDRSALTLFEDPEGTEKEMTEFLTGWMHHMRTLAASQQG